MHLGFTLLVFAPVLVMALVTSFAAQTQDPKKQLIDRLTANLQPPYQRQQNHDPPVCYHCRLTEHFSRDCNNSLLFPPAPKNNDNQNNKTINNNVLNQRPNYANINFFGKDPLVEGESTSQLEENSFYAFNLTDDDYDMNELAINTSESTRKKKKAKINFVLDLNKAFKSTADNNEPPKAKVFKNSPKLEPPKIVQKSGSYSVVKNLMEMSAHIIFGQLMTYPQFRKNLYKSLIPKKKTPNKCSHQTELADNSNIISLICKAQVAGYFIDLILNSRLSVSIIAKHFLETIGRKIDKPSIRPIINVHSNKKKGLSIAKAVSKAKALFDYELCKLTIRYSEKPIMVKCHHWTTPPVSKQSQEEEQSDESDNKESEEEDKQDKQEETTEFAYTIFTSNNKPLDNVKADKERIMVNDKLICWSYYDILKRTFDRKPDKKAKYSYWWHGPCAQCWCDKPLYSPSDECKSCLIYYKDWEPISLIPRKKLKEVQKSFENEPPEIQLLIIEQREPSPKEKKAFPVVVVFKKGGTLCFYMHLLPKIDAMLNKFNGAAFFSTIDLTAEF
ncbi:hypothetical protein G9A89_021089 [Geosiphon pyriformis]|nr:hypothetical protein G9A89_021089 [Geosiphon pyriformis]